MAQRPGFSFTISFLKLLPARESGYFDHYPSVLNIGREVVVAILRVLGLRLEVSVNPD